MVGDRLSDCAPQAVIYFRVLVRPGMPRQHCSQACLEPNVAPNAAGPPHTVGRRFRVPLSSPCRRFCPIGTRGQCGSIWTVTSSFSSTGCAQIWTPGGGSVHVSYRGLRVAQVRAHAYVCGWSFFVGRRPLRLLPRAIQHDVFGPQPLLNFNGAIM